MQKYCDKRIWAIVKESAIRYRHSKELLLLSCGILLGGLVLYIISKQVQVKDSVIEQQVYEEEGLINLEDSISTTNFHLQQYADSIDQQFKEAEQRIGVASDPVSNRNKLLIIKKIEAILRYLETPLYHFNQLPTYFINNPALEKKIARYNEEQIRVAHLYNKERRSDSSLFRALQPAQQQLIEMLNSEKELLAQQMKQPKKRIQNIPDSSKLLTSLFDKRDALMQVYSDQLARYQKQLDQFSSVQLSHLSSSPSAQASEKESNVGLRGLEANWSDLFGIVALFVMSVLIPLLFLILKWYKFPFIKRLEDLTFPSSKSNVKLELNKNVNQELVAFNYEQLIKKVDQLAKNRHSIIACYSVEAEDQQHAIGTQLSLLLAKLGNTVLHIHLSKTMHRGWVYRHAYTTSALIRHMEDIQNRLLINAKHQLHQDLYILIDEASLKKQDQLSSPLQYYWALQHFFAKAKVKEMLVNFERHFTYVVINTPDFSQLESSLLFIPLRSINIHVFKNEISPRKSANRLCALNAQDPLPTIHIIDFSENRIYQSLNKKNNDEKEPFEHHTMYS